MQRSTQQNFFSQQSSQPSYIPNPNNLITADEKKERDTLVNDIQNIIYALHFEKGPLPQGKIDNFSLLFFAMIESIFLEPLPWQKIKVAEGPKYTVMYGFLKTMQQSLAELDGSLLAAAKSEHCGQYDRVKTLLGGELSLSKDGYTAIAKALGTIQNQPGYLIDEMITRVENFFKTLEQKYTLSVYNAIAHHKRQSPGY